jgi:predicted DNA-binding transcriptional regulator AlpA
MQSQGVRPARWEPGVRVGAVMDGDRLCLDLTMPGPRAIVFDYARHRRIWNFDKNYVRLNEFPEWFVVDENTLYRLQRTGETAPPLVRLGSELIAGVELAPGEWLVERAGKPPYGRSRS